MRPSGLLFLDRSFAEPPANEHHNAGNRLYSADELERLRFIRSAQATGFTLDDIQALLRPAACGKVQRLIEERLEHVSARMKELRHVQKVLQASLTECREHEATGRCRVVDELTARSKSLK